jgi:hypothetical protein
VALLSSKAGASAGGDEVATVETDLGTPGGEGDATSGMNTEVGVGGDQTASRQETQYVPQDAPLPAGSRLVERRPTLRVSPRRCLWWW